VIEVDVGGAMTTELVSGAASGCGSSGWSVASSVSRDSGREVGAGCAS